MGLNSSRMVSLSDKIEARAQVNIPIDIPIDTVLEPIVTATGEVETKVKKGRKLNK